LETPTYVNNLLNSKIFLVKRLSFEGKPAEKEEELESV
jgi:hypothetical protein